MSIGIYMKLLEKMFYKETFSRLGLGRLSGQKHVFFSLSLLSITFTVLHNKDCTLYRG